MEKQLYFKINYCAKNSYILRWRCMLLSCPGVCRTFTDEHITGRKKEISDALRSHIAS